ncbi:bile acid:Na+ symporter, BASS family [Alteribacillus persepolensis]|uniref:Bile acid:Na+ symporter, BASS family n=1 Tax=Alteribacillus persepolensis TaxID=568899 RepID=A0A1G8ED72_9BACI|nr:bile acid:sodium symporter [Alteribacillus persepolensis]SDH67895.1 bile acid:Na+ symporter, BASS family [Alteribacillus persepolensis]
MAFIEEISKRLPFLIVFTAIVTYFSPVYLETAAWIPSFLLGIVIFFTGLSMNLGAVRGIKQKKKVLLLAAFLKWTVTVFISIALAYIFFSEEAEIAAGLILSGTVPSATAATLYTFLAGGNTALVIAGSLIDTGISPLVTLLAMMNIPDNQVSITFIDLLQSFVLIVILPLSVGIFVQRLFPQAIQYSKPLTKLGSSLALLCIVHIIVGEGAEAIASRIELLPLLVVVIFIQVALPMGLGYYIAKKARTKEEDARAILFHVGLCNTALAAILAFEFIGELGAAPPIINTIINLSVGSFIANRLGHRQSGRNIGQQQNQLSS